MLWLKRMALVTTVALGGCIGGFGSPEMQPAGDLNWVDGPSPEVRSLVLQPAALDPDDPSIPQRPVVSLGAYLARLETEEGARRHLALLVQLEGQGTAMDLDLQQGLVVELDGQIYQVDLSLSGESVFMDRTAEGRRLTLSFPVDRADLEDVLQADEVRVRVGGSCYFRVAEVHQDRLRRFVDRLPPDGIVARPAMFRAD